MLPRNPARRCSRCGACRVIAQQYPARGPARTWSFRFAGREAEAHRGPRPHDAAAESAGDSLSWSKTAAAPAACVGTGRSRLRSTAARRLTRFSSRRTAFRSWPRPVEVQDCGPITSRVAVARLQHRAVRTVDTFLSRTAGRYARRRSSLTSVQDRDPTRSRPGSPSGMPAVIDAPDGHGDGFSLDRRACTDRATSPTVEHRRGRCRTVFPA